MDVFYDFRVLPQYLEVLKTKLKIAVIYGGDKRKKNAVIYQTHNPRPWKDYKVVAEDIASSLTKLGFKYVSLMPDDMSLAENLKRQKIDLAWLNTGGVQGYNPVSHTPALLEMLGVPYIGHNPLNSSTLDNKHAFKRELEGLHVPTARFMIWDSSQGPIYPEKDPLFKSIFKDYKGPFIVKPVSGRASLNVEFVDSVKLLSKSVSEVYSIAQNHVLIEEFLPGKEYCVAVSGYVVHVHSKFQKFSHPFAFSPIERSLDANEKIFTSMDVKPITMERVKILDRKKDSKELEELEELAQKVYEKLNLKSLIRLDIRADAEGKLRVLEANPKPDLKCPKEGKVSLVAAGLPKHDMSYEDLIYSLLADRIDQLLTHRQITIPHIVDLIL